MIILNVTFVVEDVHAGGFPEWVKSSLLPGWANHANAKLLRVSHPGGNPDDTGSQNFSLQLEFASKEELVKWQDTKFEPGIRLCFEKFAGKALPFCTLLEPLEL